MRVFFDGSIRSTPSTSTDATNGWATCSRVATRRSWWTMTATSRRLGGKRSADVSRAQREPARARRNCLQRLPRYSIFRAMRCSTAATCRAYPCAVYLLRRVVNEPIAKVARRAGISAPRVSQIQAEAENAKPQGPMRRLLDRYKVKR